MSILSGLLDRGRVSNFSRNYYEVVFSIFTVAIAYFYRDNPRIVYPTILYFFLLLMVSNLAFNQLLRKRVSVSLWAIDFTLIFNLCVITGVLYYSGGGESYFWVLYLLPIFAAAMLGRLEDVAGVVLLSSLATALFSRPLRMSDLAEVMSLLVKLSVFIVSAAAVYRSANARKKAETALQSKRREVEAMTRELMTKDTELAQTASAGEVGQLVSGIMHDLGNSLSVILLSAQLADEDDAPDKKDIGRIVKAAQFSRTLIANALNIVRGREYVFEPGDIREPLENAVQLVSYAAMQKGAAVRTEVQPGLPRINMSKVHIERLFINTLFNSLSFVPQHGEVTVKVAAGGNKLTIEIADNGPGFPESMLKDGIKAFRTTRKAAGGTGLGLHVCVQIAEKHGGKLAIANGPSGGSVVKVTLPVFTG